MEREEEDYEREAQQQLLQSPSGGCGVNRYGNVQPWYNTVIYFTHLYVSRCSGRRAYLKKKICIYIYIYICIYM